MHEDRLTSSVKTITDASSVWPVQVCSSPRYATGWSSQPSLFPLVEFGASEGPGCGSAHKLHLLFFPRFGKRQRRQTHFACGVIDLNLASLACFELPFDEEGEEGTILSIKFDFTNPAKELGVGNSSMESGLLGKEKGHEADEISRAKN